jgi:hypothetical protein
LLSAALCHAVARAIELILPDRLSRSMLTTRLSGETGPTLGQPYPRSICIGETIFLGRICFGETGLLGTEMVWSQPAMRSQRHNLIAICLIFEAARSSSGAAAGGSSWDGKIDGEGTCGVS